MTQVSIDTDGGRPIIPVLDVGTDFGLGTLELAAPMAHALLDGATAGIPRVAFRMADAISRSWLVRSHHPHLPEIDQVAARIARPGAHFFNVHYEWGCTSAIKGSSQGTARLYRVLDWRTRGLGRHVVAARVSGTTGPWISLTWPGFTGVLQAMAPGRFSAALNQAPMAMPTGLMPADWAVNRYRVWRRPHLTPAHLLRRVFEEARDFATARLLLAETPLCAPAIYTLAGLDEAEGCVIERTEDDARVLAHSRCAANAWQTVEWRGRPRGPTCQERVAALSRLEAADDASLSWLSAPVLNCRTRLAMVADAAQGRLIAQGYEEDGPATAPLTLAA